MHETARRLHQAAKEMRGVKNASGLARLLIESPQTIKNWETRGVSRQGAVKAQAVIGCDANWILNGIGNMRHPHALPAESAALDLSLETQSVRPEKFGFVVVVGQGAGGSLPERIWTDGDYPVGATNDYAEVISVDPHAFVVRVVGPSMIPKYTPGDYALVEPETEPDLEDDVLVRLGNGQTMIKRLLSRRGDHVRLGSYNDADVLIYDKSDITWMYYVAYPVPARKIKSRI